MDLVLHDSALGGFWRIWKMVRGVMLLAPKGDCIAFVGIGNACGKGACVGV